ncbi:MAG: hypothetical protein AAB857_01630 [Patescibacteria group bacterium]|mgnify:CR=1 FL=1
MIPTLDTVTSFDWLALGLGLLGVAVGVLAWIAQMIAAFGRKDK